MYLTKREKILLIILAIVAVIAIYYFYFYNPLQQSIETLNREIEADLSVIATLGDKQQQIEQLEQQVFNIQSTIDDLFIELPSRAGDANLVVYINEITRPIAYKRFIHILDPEYKPEFVQVPVQMALDMEYANIKKLFKTLENSPFRNSVISFSINGQGYQWGDVVDGSFIDTEGDADLNISISMVFYFKVEQDIEGDYPFIEGQYGKDDPFH